MGYEKIRRPLMTTVGSVDTIQSLTDASTGTNVLSYGVTKLTIAGGTATTAIATMVFTIDPPDHAGQRKILIVDNNATQLVQIRTASSAAASNFFGTTKNAVQWATGSTDAPGHAELLGISTAQWALINISSTSISILGATA